MSSNDGQPITPEMLYGENAASYRYISDWRHRIMDRFFLALGLNQACFFG